MRPYLLIDVDGVLNALCCQFTNYAHAERHTCQNHHGWVKTEGLGFPLLLNPVHGASLLALAEETGAELAWGSTWMSYANDHIAPVVGLPALPYAPVSRGLHKPPTVVPWTDGRPFVWLDDDVSIPEDAARLAPQRHLIVTVDAQLGLRDSDLDKARGWLLAL